MTDQPTAEQYMAALLYEHGERADQIEQQKVALVSLRRERDDALDENARLLAENNELRGYLLRMLAVAADAQHVATGTPPPPPPPPIPPMSNPLVGPGPIATAMIDAAKGRR